MGSLRFGANHTPSGSWFYGWLDPEWAAFRRDFEAIAALGLDHVRLLPLWPVLQPNRTLIRPRAVADVRRAVELAGACGLDASVDVLQGHLSSFDFVPGWLTSWHGRNLFTDAEAVAAQVELVTALDQALGDLPTFLGLTLGNEVNQFSGAAHPHPMAITPDQAAGWLTALHEAPGRTPGRFRVNAEDDAAFYDDGHAFLPTHPARWGDLTVVHSWVFNGTAQRYGGMSEASLRHAEYLVELSRAFAVDRDRPVWLQEVGAPLNHVRAQRAPDFLDATVRSAADSDALWGVTWWCSHDVPRALADFPDLEHDLGLLDETGAVKPVGQRFAEVAAELRDRPRPGPRTVAVIIPVDDADVPPERGELGPGGGVLETWLRLVADGIRPALITSRHAADRAEVVRLGFRELVTAPRTGRGCYRAVSSEALSPEG